MSPSPNVRKFTSAEVAEKQAKIHGHKPRRVVAESVQQQDGMPAGYRVLDATVYTNGTDIVVTASPHDIWPEDDGEKHNCDAMGCAWGHVIARAELERKQS